MVAGDGAQNERHIVADLRRRHAKVTRGVQRVNYLKAGQAQKEQSSVSPPRKPSHNRIYSVDQRADRKERECPTT